MVQGSHLTGAHSLAWASQIEFFLSFFLFFSACIRLLKVNRNNCTIVLLLLFFIECEGDQDTQQLVVYMLKSRHMTV